MTLDKDQTIKTDELLAIIGRLYVQNVMLSSQLQAVRSAGDDDDDDRTQEDAG